MQENVRNIFLGTGNVIKRLEIARFFEQNNAGYRIIPFEEKLEIEELGDSFEEIARWKVLKYTEYLHGQLFISDDSGLCIDCLDGRPGIYSARFPYKGVSDEERNCAIIDLLKKLDVSEITATFYSAEAVGINGRVIASSVGTCKGRVILEPKGKNGFGFDPIFIPNGMDKTFAQMSIDEKLKVSHRGAALKGILTLLKVESEKENEK